MTFYWFLLGYMLSSIIHRIDTKMYDTYLWNDIIYDDTRFDPEIGLAIEWKSIDELCDENVSPFAKYNRKVFEALNIMRQL